MSTTTTKDTRVMKENMLFIVTKSAMMARYQEIVMKSMKGMLLTIQASKSTR